MMLSGSNCSLKRASVDDDDEAVVQRGDFVPGQGTMSLADECVMSNCVGLGGYSEMRLGQSESVQSAFEHRLTPTDFRSKLVEWQRNEWRFYIDGNALGSRNRTFAANRGNY